MIVSVTKELAIGLYKNLYKYGRQLKYTDREFYYKYVRNQFEKSKQEVDPERTQRLIKVFDSLLFESQLEYSWLLIARFDLLV